ncbi:MAG: [Fe-Fe] hydrogenase large subunit C-terminal domain-containing protein [Armatimonadota bacterium]|jgi:iron only hydrogenase large subunit-like protein/uncharacterized Fe-S cluster-containing protein
MPNLGVVTTNKARCRDCYRCVRVCPVKAIRISDGQAQVYRERCIVCGTCVRECPQKAKQVRSDLSLVKELRAGHCLLIASVAPSYVAAFPNLGGGLFPAFLKRLGFDMVTETAVGAEMVAAATARLVADEPESHIASACPVIVSLIAQYYPWAIEKLAPLVSPMIAHGRYLKRIYGEDAQVVFIGPCPAKKAEAEEPDVLGAVDAVLTFNELRLWMEESGIRKDTLRSCVFDDIPAASARLFPLEGGLARAASMAPDMLRQDFAAVSGCDEVHEMLKTLKDGSTIRLFEALFCPSGCINGASFGDGRDIYHRKNRILQHEKRSPRPPSAETFLQASSGVELGRTIIPRPVEQPQYTPEEVRAVLIRIGKRTEEDELNCGACGYHSCKDNAIALLSGMAEDAMCIPWMRKLAERKADQIIDASPNAIVIIDEGLRVYEFNPAFAQIFSCTPGLVGKPLSCIMDPEDFEKVLARAVDRVTNKLVSYPNYHVSGSLNVYRLEDEDLVVGIISNVNKSTEGLNRLDQIRAETLANAEQVIGKQMLMAQEIASILGETTSETRVLLRKLTELMKESDTPAADVPTEP